MYYEYDFILKYIYYCYDGLLVVWQMIWMIFFFYEIMFLCNVIVVFFIIIYDYLFFV